MLPSFFQRLVKQLSSFPGVGPRVANRYAFYLLHQDSKKIKELIDNLQELKKIKLCSECFLPFYPSKAKEKLCPICRNDSRQKTLLCIVEKESDLYAIEETQAYKGLYFLIGSAHRWFERKDSSLRTKKLIAKIKKASPKIEEVILAVNYTVEGQALSSYLQKLLQPFSLKVTHLRQGLPVGSEVEYADAETLKKSFQGRE
jgi:recombination protein RecR